MTSVLSMPMFDPGAGRLQLELPAGLTVREIVEQALPHLAVSQWSRLRIAFAAPTGFVDGIARNVWDRVRPRPGVKVIIRLAPAGDQLRSVLLTVVSIAAVALGQFWAVPLATALGATAFTGLIAAGLTLGITALGTLLVNALVPARSGTNSARDAEKPNYSISSYRNTANPDGIIPAPLGYHRQAPNFFLAPYSEIVGNDQYMRAGMVFGYGPLVIRNIKIGETPIERFSDVTYEVRQGFADDAPVSICPEQVLEDNLGIELRRDYPRDSAGTVITDVTPAEDPITRWTASDITEVGLIIGFPAGLAAFNDAGELQQIDVSIRVRQRLLPAGGFTDVTTLNFTGKQSEGFFRQYRWDVGTRGRYEIELTRMTNERTTVRQNDRSVWTGLQSYRPEYPINFDKPLALLTMLIKATHQLNGTLDTVNAEVSRICPDWDAPTGTWITRETVNPASLYRWVLQGPAATFPEADAAMNLSQLQDWHEFCVANGLKYDRLHDHESSQWDVLADVAAAGRASPAHDGRQWGVLIDRSGELVVDHISSANSHSFAWSRTYFQPPDAFRVSFLDRTNSYANAERIVPWPGHAGDIKVTESISMPGKTDPVEVYREGRRRAYELLYRADRLTAVQAGTARRATRGDRVMGSFPSIIEAQDPHRVRQVAGNMVRLDGLFEMELGKSYGCRYRVFDEAGNMTSVLRPVVTHAGETDILTFIGAAQPPAIDEWVHFGILDEDSLSLIVASVEAGEDMSTVLTLVAEAPEVDELVDADIVPAWDGRVGGAIDDDVTAPVKPVVVSVEPLASGFRALLVPGAGDPISVASFALRHRLVGSGSWSGPVTVAAGAGALSVTGYAPGASIQWQAQSIGRNGVGSLYTDLVTSAVPVPEGAPDAIPSGAVTGGLGSASILFSTPADARLDKVNIYRGSTSVFGSAAKVATLSGVLPSSTYTHVDGDGTRVSAVANGNFDSDTVWTKGTDWTIATGKASKAAGSAADLSQALTLIAAKTYRYRATILDRTAGSLTPKLIGTTTVGGGAISANSTVLGSLVAVAGNNALAFAASSTFDGSIDSVVLFEESPTSLPQGQHHYFITTVNAAEAESAPLALPTVTVI